MTRFRCLLQSRLDLEGSYSGLDSELEEMYCLRGRRLREEPFEGTAGREEYGAIRKEVK